MSSLILQDGTVLRYFRRSAMRKLAELARCEGETCWRLGQRLTQRRFPQRLVNQPVRRDTLIGGNRPTPVHAIPEPENEPAVPSFMTPQLHSEDIDELLEGSLLPDMLEL
jgi:hypothetical protein